MSDIGLPPPPAWGLYQHYKGPIYQVLFPGAHDADAESMFDNEGNHLFPPGPDGNPLREVVVYMATDLAGARLEGFRIAVRTLQWFEELVCADERCAEYGSPERDLTVEDIARCRGHFTPRFYNVSRDGRLTARIAELPMTMGVLENRTGTSEDDSGAHEDV